MTDLSYLYDTVSYTLQPTLPYLNTIYRYVNGIVTFGGINQDEYFGLSLSQTVFSGKNPSLAPWREFEPLTPRKRENLENEILQAFQRGEVSMESLSSSKSFQCLRAGLSEIVRHLDATGLHAFWFEAVEVDASTSLTTSTDLLRLHTRECAHYIDGKSYICFRCYASHYVEQTYVSYKERTLFDILYHLVKNDIL